MKRKVEKYIYSKNIDGVHRVVDSTGRYLIGRDIEGCLRAVRTQTVPSNRQGGSRRKSRELVPIQSSGLLQTNPISKSTSPPLLSSKRPFDVSFNVGNNYHISGSGVSPASNTVLENRYTKKRLIPQQASPSDLAELKTYLFSNMKGGYVNGIYHSALERRRICESIMSQGTVTPESLNSLNLTESERYHMPPFFHSWLPFLTAYVDPRMPTYMNIQTPFTHAMSPMSGLIHSNMQTSPLCADSGVRHHSASPNKAFFEQSFRPSPVACKKHSGSSPTPRFGA